jgi:hypothetical protein
MKTRNVRNRQRRRYLRRIPMRDPGYQNRSVYGSAQVIVGGQSLCLGHVLEEK